MLHAASLFHWLHIAPFSRILQAAQSLCLKDPAKQNLRPKLRRVIIVSGPCVLQQ